MRKDVQAEASTPLVARQNPMSINTWGKGGRSNEEEVTRGGERRYDVKAEGSTPPVAKREPMSINT